jgi:hypothetical protein
MRRPISLQTAPARVVSSRRSLTRQGLRQAKPEARGLALLHETRRRSPVGALSGTADRKSHPANARRRAGSESCVRWSNPGYGARRNEE